jgi:Na+-driven multidrug efflux pump
MGAAVNAITTFFSFVFLVLQIYFWGQGDSHMMTLMCGMCLLCVGLRAGWILAGKRRGGDVE